MSWVKDRLKIGQERGCIRCCKDDFEHFDLTGKNLDTTLPRTAKYQLQVRQILI
jgi:hypothetical protein